MSSLLVYLIGIVSGISITIIGYEYQRFRNAKEKKTEEMHRFYHDTKALLIEIFDTCNKYKSQNHVNKDELKAQYSIFSSQLTKLISKAPRDVSNEIIEEIRTISAKMNLIKDIPIVSGPTNHNYFMSELDGIAQKITKILRKMEKMNFH